MYFFRLQAILVLILASFQYSQGQKEDGARLEIQNEANIDIDVYWRDEGDRSYALLTSIDKGLKGGLNTYKGHKFLVAPRGRDVGFGEIPNFVMQRPEQDMVIKGDSNKLLVVESNETRQRAGLPPRQPSNYTGIHAHIPATQASLIVKNDASCQVAVWWFNEKERKYQQISQIPLGAERMINSFRGHELYIGRYDEDVSADTHASNFQLLNDFKSIRLLDTEGIELDILDDDSTPAPIDINRENIKATIQRCQGAPACISNMVFRPKLSAIQKQQQIELTTRDEVEEKYRDFACLNYETLVPDEYETTEWTYDPDNEGEEAGSVGWTKDESVSAVKRRDMKIHHLFDSARDDARIYLVDNMVSENECAALKKNASPRLQAASVTGDSPGEKIVSKARKAKSAMVKPQRNIPDDPLVDLQDRIFDFVNYHANENFELPGQEPFNVIMYNKTGDEYKVHCDGYCDSSLYMKAGRAATVVVFCEEAARGGQTSFTNSDLVLKGKAGQAAFFHYRDADNYMDSGWTKHSGCPVLEGTKWISTQWIRDGVDDDHPWFHYTPTGDLDFADMGRRDPNY